MDIESNKLSLTIALLNYLNKMGRKPQRAATLLKDNSDLIPADFLSVPADAQIQILTEANEKRIPIQQTEHYRKIKAQPSDSDKGKKVPLEICRCPHGHFYNGAEHSECPTCASGLPAENKEENKPEGPKLNIARCPRGHFYDSNADSECPYCDRLANTLSKIKTGLEKKRLLFEIRTVGNLMFVEAVFTGKTCNTRIHLIPVNNGAEVKIQADTFAVFPPEKRNEGYVLLNDLNRRYKYTRFSMAPNGCVSAQYDISPSVVEKCLEDAVYELTMSFASIIDTVYPQCMKLIWGGPNTK